MKHENLLTRITVDSKIFNGSPIIRGMRFKVADVLDYLASGMTPEEILKEFPYLQKKDIEASLFYASRKIDHAILRVELNEA